MTRRPRIPVAPGQLVLPLDRVIAVAQTTTGRPLFVLPGGRRDPGPVVTARKERAA